MTVVVCIAIGASLGALSGAALLLAACCGYPQDLICEDNFVCEAAALGEGAN
jgi:hypothetical protein